MEDIRKFLRRYGSALLLLLLIGCFILLGTVGLYWRNIRPGGIDGVRVMTQLVVIDLCAERPGSVWKSEPVKHAENRPGYLHLGIYAMDVQFMWESVGISGIRRTKHEPDYYEESAPPFASLLPVVHRSQKRGGLHVCYGFPQTLAWLSLLTAGASFLHIRYRRRMKSAPGNS